MIGVAILETDPMVRSILEGHMAKIDGFELIGSADSLKAAKKLYATGKVQLVLGEVHFQDGELLDWVGQLRSQKKPLDFIVVTGDVSYATLRMTLQLGVIDYLLKPFTYARFRESMLRYRILQERLAPDLALSQTVLDEFFFAEEVVRRVSGDRGDKNFSKHTYDMIYAYAREHSDTSFTATEIAENMGVSRITARRYLELMEKEKVLDVELQYGKVGRPKNRYRYKGTE